MRKIILLFSMMFIIVACHDKNKTSGKLTAVLENIPDGTILNIYDIDSGKIISRIPVYENKFEFSFRFQNQNL
ncbi:MAG: hypothetical protein IPH69_05410 [Bacteroidales bacterium]|nr:hypothetical protein [Bacteroidales bacterium]